MGNYVPFMSVSSLHCTYHLFVYTAPTNLFITTVLHVIIPPSHSATIVGLSEHYSPISWLLDLQERDSRLTHYSSTFPHNSLWGTSLRTIMFHMSASATTVSTTNHHSSYHIRSTVTPNITPSTLTNNECQRHLGYIASLWMPAAPKVLSTSLHSYHRSSILQSYMYTPITTLFGTTLLLRVWCMLPCIVSARIAKQVSTALVGTHS